MDGQLHFRGSARVYLQGLNALEVAEPISEKMMVYFIGGPESSIKVKDLREQPNKASHAALQGQGVFEFADVFNQPANVHVYASDNETEITLEETSDSDADRTLWLGVIDTGKIPVHTICWEVLKPLQDNRIAFAAIIGR